MKTNTNNIESKFKSNYDPEDKNYLNHISQNELCDILEVNRDSVIQIKAMLKQISSTEIDHSYCNEFLQFTSGIPYVAKMLSLFFYDSIASIEGDNYFHSKFTSFPLKNQTKPTIESIEYDDSLPKCIYDQTDPVCLKKVYNADVEVESSSMPQAVANFGGDFFKPSDLSAFWEMFNLKETNVTVMNDNHESEAALESTLDLEYITGMGNNIDTQFYHFSCTTEKCHPFHTMLMQLMQLDDDKLPKVLSVSVGVTEYEYLNELGKDYADQVNTEFMKLGLRGVSVIFAVGDKADQEYAGKKWINFPASSPYVTSVGGVWLGDINTGPLEVDPMTTGGFSNHFDLPAWQKDAVGAWKSKYGGKGPKNVDYTKRAVPDLSAMSAFYKVLQDGGESWAGGTSAGTPVVAGMVSVINQKRAEAGKKSMGFLNPFLYKNADCFTDVIGGSNLYDAVAGWDPASGLGTVKLDCLLDRALKE